MLWLFVPTVWLSALLLFLVQPMAGRLALPLFGGSPAVWTTLMLFFQAGLLAGYAWAHLLTRALAPRLQGPVHLLVMLAGAAVLPLLPDRLVPPPDGADPAFWLLAQMALLAGLPFLAVAANAPLLQRWFSLTRHRDAANPYFLYAASNLGSVLALVGYPVLAEPLLGLAAQGHAWLAGYVLLAVGVLCCWRVVPVAPARPAATVAAAAERIGWRRRLVWLALSAVPSSLMLGTTLHITTDIAAAPFLWAGPLALYLLSFVVVFARTGTAPQPVWAWLQAAAVIPVAMLFFTPPQGLWFNTGLHLLAFFLTALVLHGELARRRPTAARLTEFYFWMSLGGVLGGLFNALLAPRLFDSVVEYPLALVLAALLRPALAAGSWRRDLLWPALLALLLLPAAATPALDPRTAGPTAALLAAIVLAATALLLLAFSVRPLRFALGLLAVLAADRAFLRDAGRPLAAERSFFGVHRVHDTADGAYRILSHGTTIHGVQALAPGRRTEPISYYAAAGPVGAVFGLLDSRRPAPRVAIVGLGAGAIAGYRPPGAPWDFYEIDPVVVRLAREAGLFDFLPAGSPGAEVILGDARLGLARPDRPVYDLIVLDAFSSDAVPVHLLTLEAFAVWLDRLAPDGLLLVNVSNWHVDLEPVMAAAAREHGLAALLSHFRPSAHGIADPYVLPATWVVLSRRRDVLAGLAGDWRRLDLPAGFRPWTDDHADLFGVIRWGGIGGG